MLLLFWVFEPRTSLGLAKGCPRRDPKVTARVGWLVEGSKPRPCGQGLVLVAD